MPSDCPWTVIGPVLPELPPVPRTSEVDAAPKPIRGGLLIALAISLGLWALFVWLVVRGLF